MRQAAPGVTLTAAQQRAADSGIKTLIPIAGRPFLDRLLAALDAAGLGEVLVVVGLAHQPLVDHCRALAETGRSITTAVLNRSPVSSHDS